MEKKGKNKEIYKYEQIKLHIMLDNIDQMIVDEVVRDSDRNIEQLAHAVNLPKSTVHARKKKLEEMGIIRGYKAIPDYKKINKELCVFTHVTLKENADTASVIKYFQKNPNVLEIHTTTGEVDLIIKSRFKDTKELNDFLFQTEHGARHTQGVLKTNSMIALESFKEDGWNLVSP